MYRDHRHQKEARMILHYGDLLDATCLLHIISSVAPDEIYNLGAQSHVKVSFEMPDFTADVDALGALRVLDAIRTAGLTHKTRFYQASTSELYGKVQETPQSEKTPFYPRSPYAVAKQFGYWMVVNYREAYGMFAVNGILFNHESPRRGPTFVTRKTTRAVAKIKHGKQDVLYLGNLDSKRDWGHARDYVEAMWMMLQADTPEDYVCGTGETHTVREMVEIAFSTAGLTITWEGKGVDEVGRDQTGAPRVKVDPSYYRPTEVDLLLSDPRKIMNKLGWKPRIRFRELIQEMVRSDLEDVAKEKVLW